MKTAGRLKCPLRCVTLMLQETERSAPESMRGLLWLIVFVSANIFFIYYVFEDQKLYRRLVTYVSFLFVVMNTSNFV